MGAPHRCDGVGARRSAWITVLGSSSAGLTPAAPSARSEVLGGVKRRQEPSPRPSRSSTRITLASRPRRINQLGQSSISSRSGGKVRGQPPCPRFTPRAGAPTVEPDVPSLDEDRACEPSRRSRSVVRLGRSAGRRSSRLVFRVASRMGATGARRLCWRAFRKAECR